MIITVVLPSGLDLSLWYSFSIEFPKPSFGLVNQPDPSLPSKAAQGKKAGIFWVLVKCFWPTFCLGAIYQLIYSLLQFTSPQILGLIISFVEGSDPNWKGYLYTILFAITAVSSSIADSRYAFVNFYCK